ncbi:MAG TPA: CdaR family protein [Candidatus Polarisedimenticolia bacterium]|nr:CdaR family protein [Candidatus Polarisedimenticolia bacterium]
MFLRSNRSLKVASVILAIFVWMYVRGEARPQQIFSVPLELEGLPEDLALAGEVPETVLARVRAPDSTLRNLSPGRFRARIRLDGARPGDLTVPLAPEMIRAPLGVEVERVDPRSLSLRVERRLTKEVPVTARVIGEPASGYEYDGYVLSTRLAVIEGPEGMLSLAREALTSEVRIDGRSESFETNVDLVPDRAGIKLVGQAVATLRVNIRERRMTQVYAGVRLVPKFPAGVTYKASIKPEILTVVLQGPRDALAGIRSEDIRAVLDLEGMGPRDAPYSVPPRVVFTPEGLGTSVQVHSVSDPSVEVRISR